MFPISILRLFDKIKGIKGASVCLDNGRGEAEIHAPDEKEVEEEEEQKAFKLLEELKYGLYKNGFIFKCLERSGGIDAIRIYIGNNEGEYMKNEKEVDLTTMDLKSGGQPDSTCPKCGNKIEKAACTVHEEPYEMGHKDNCPYKQSIKKECLID